VRHHVQGVTTRFLVGGFLVSLCWLCGCGGSGNQSPQITTGASITKRAKVQAVVGSPILSGQGSMTVYTLHDEDGRVYVPSNLSADFAKDGMSVQFTAIVENTQVPADALGIPITITAIQSL